MIVAVTGGRDYKDAARVFATLDAVHAQYQITLLVHGACHLGGADILAEQWAKAREIDYRGYPAKFKTGSAGKFEGPLRNARMLEDARPALLVEFPGGNGTANAVAHATRLGIAMRFVEGP